MTVRGVSPGRQNTLLIEKNPTGHRLYYVRLLAIAAYERGDHVTIALNSAYIDAEEIPVHLNGLPPTIRIIHGDKFDVESIARLSNCTNAAITVVPDGDRFAIALGRRRSWPARGTLSVLIMREIAQPSGVPGLQIAKSWIRHFFFRRAARLRGVELSILKPIGWSGAAAFSVAIDPVTMTSSGGDAVQLRDDWGLGDDRYWFAVLGAISERKNVSLIAHAIGQLPARRVGFLVAGKCDAETAERMRRPIAELRARGVAVIVKDRLLQDSELDSAVSMVDCMVLAHSNEGSSGLFGKSTAAGTRIIAAGARSLQRDCAVIPESASWVPLEESALAAAMTAALTLPRPSPSSPQGAAAFTTALL